LRHTRAILFRAENNIKPGVACPGVLAYKQLDGVDARMSRDCCVFFAYNTGSSYVMKTFSGEKDKQLFEDGFQRINSLGPSQVFQTLREKPAYEKTGNYLPAVHTPTVSTITA
jgi:hypothetical protein